MIIYKGVKNTKPGIEREIKELEVYKESYDKYLDYIKIMFDSNEKEENVPTNVDKKMNVINTQLIKIKKNIELLQYLIDNYNEIETSKLRKCIYRYNKKYKEIKSNYIINIATKEDNEIIDIVYGNEEEVKENKEEKAFAGALSNDTLLISEVENKVILPYSATEIKEILDSNTKYEKAEDVVNEVFTRPLADYKIQFLARYNETVKLLTKTSNYSRMNIISVAIEMMLKKYLHPAIISACKNVDELNVYLDCLAKGEVDEFKIFKIKYELYPTIAKGTHKIKDKTSLIKNNSKVVKKLFYKKKEKSRDVL